MSLRLRERELPHLCRALGVELRSKLAPDGQPYADAWLSPCLECGADAEWQVNDGGLPACYCSECVRAGKQASWRSYSVTELVRRLAPHGHLEASVPTLVNKTPPVELIDLTVKDLFDQPEAGWLPVLRERGFLARGITWLLSSRPKCGKTTLLYHACKEWTDAGLRVLMLSEEPRSIVRMRCRRLDLSAPLLGVYAGRGRPWKDVLDWLEGEEFDVVVIDTTRYWFRLPPEGANDDGTVQAAVAPVQGIIRDKNAGLVLSHHLRKAGGSDGTAHGGSTAWVSVSDVATELHRYPQQLRRRLLRSEGRFMEVTPAELLIELRGPGEYVSLGDAENLKLHSVKARVLTALAAGDGQTETSLRDHMDPKPSTGELSKALRELLGEEPSPLKRTGEGKRGDPYVYWRA